MLPENIQIGTRLELELLEDSEKAQETYVSQLLEHQEDGNIVIATPIFEARLIIFAPESILRLSFIHANGDLLGFIAHVIKRDLKDNLSVLIVKPVSELYKFQRRTNYRLVYTTNVSMKLNDYSLPPDKRTVIKTQTKNISGSGLCVVSNVSLEKGTILSVELFLTDKLRITAKCVVKRCESFEMKKTRMYNIGLHFHDISKKNQERLIKFIFEQQRLLLKKGIQP